MELIGLSGYARSGKDEAAKVLIEEFGFTRVAFADKLREVLYELNPMVIGMHEIEQDGQKIMVVTQPPTPRLLNSVIGEYGWDGYKESEFGPEIRRLLQRLGTEAGRKTLWDSIWIDAALTNFDEDAKVVVTDCRFPNEAQAIKDRGGQVWRITREGVGPATGADGSVHPSETSLDDWPFDWNIGNVGSLEDYREDIRSSYGSIAYLL